MTISIDKERNFFLLFHDLSDKPSHNNTTSDTKIHEFPLISGYVCPECGKVIKAYYTGVPDHLLNSSSSTQQNPYLHNEKKSYGNKMISSKEGFCNGGSYFILQCHEHFCKLYILDSPGILNALKMICSKHCFDEVPTLTDGQLEIVAAKIVDNKVPGLFLVNDVCNVDEPLLAIDIKILDISTTSYYFNDNIVKYIEKQTHL